MSTRREPLVSAVALRVPTAAGAFTAQKEECLVAEEGFVMVDVRDVGAYTIMCTPSDERALAVGFLYSERIIERVEDIAMLRECEDTPGVLRVTLTDRAASAAPSGEGRLVVSSCGSCGSRSVAERLAQLPCVEDTMVVDAEVLGRVARSLTASQRLFDRCGGTHAVALFDQGGKTLSFAEDMGRHNALDKAIGKRLLRGESTAHCGAMLSGRVSLEMVGKCARAGIELIAAVSAPTSLAIEAAERTGITLCAFVREQRASVFTHARRVRIPS
ncbi:MAG: formate dehydrogenase accessory sulfurtransferase FdhD [Myxococcota bacterium]|nr:formate dehydrogenase accessory sulfurtransferase FdhD [Myxococcota bacterium]